MYDFGGLPVYVDTRSLRYMEGSELAYEKTLMYQGFRFRNPLEELTCGCGMTFNMRKQLKTV